MPAETPDKPEKSDTKPLLIIIDGYSFLFRAYHAVRGALSRSDGLPTNALYGFAQMLLRVTQDMQPDACVVALDTSAPTFRHDLYPDYKGNRPDIEPDMAAQIPYFKELIEAFAIPALSQDGLEADDVIASLSHQYQKTHEVRIISSDKDLLQLINPYITMVDTMKDNWMTPAKVEEKYGIRPDQMVDYLALVGDSSDNVPGVPSVGPKTAAQLLQDYQTLDDIYENIDNITRASLQEKLRTYQEQAFLSRKLVTLKYDAKLACTEDDMHYHYDPATAAAFLQKMEFRTLTNRVRNGKGNGKSSGNASGKSASSSASAAAPGHSPLSAGFDRSRYTTVQTVEDLQSWLAKATETGLCAFDTETTSLNAMQAQLVGVSLALAPNEACYIPLAHKGEGKDGDFLSEAPPQIPLDVFFEHFRPFLANNNVTKVAHNLKYDLLILANALQVDDFNFLHNWADTMLLSGVLYGGQHNHKLDDLSQRYLQHTMISYTEVAGTGQKQVTFDRVPLAPATRYAAEDADATLRLYHLFKEDIDASAKAELQDVYRKLEKPCLLSLAQMERHGIAVDCDQLRRLSAEFGQEIADLEAEIHKMAGTTFNVNSPKQLGDVLFDQMHLPEVKKRSTAHDVLEKLANEGHAIAHKLLDYRAVSKLRSTYTEALMEQINPRTGRVHTSYNPVGAATGRLSSSDPNLQNIPIRTADGRKIRQAFVPAPGHIFMSADYSQIELRLLAHFSRSVALTEAFQGGQDIHAFTAARVFDIPAADVQPDQRRIAKILNFGLIYGMGAHSVAQQLGMPRQEAQTYVDRFFQRYDGVKEYMEHNKQFARQHGYVTTLWGRRVHLPDIHSKNGGLRAAAERAAINAPLQGSNADMIKRVIPLIEDKLKADGLRARILLQIHDEILLEIPNAETTATAHVVKHLMETTTTLRVPVEVGIGWGHNWDEAH